ncbi:hypothetical protein ANCDUO_00091 [Ancylostoma duodenale]|uniref:Uncharacterized protein n=1 Tax=Ancylostoma duodenale TaxID=51022 RepID=A0A0C2E2A0_9BILA|nr:hypothetical protein ANCDUO_00091 [Ancylostoma duodenale]
MERRLSMMEMKIFRSITHPAGIYNKYIRERFGVTPVTYKLFRNQPSWYGNVLRANDDTVCEITYDLKPPRTWSKKPQKQRRLNILHANLKRMSVIYG